MDSSSSNAKRLKNELKNQFPEVFFEQLISCKKKNNAKFQLMEYVILILDYRGMSFSDLDTINKEVDNLVVFSKVHYKN